MKVESQAPFQIEQNGNYRQGAWSGSVDENITVLGILAKPTDQDYQKQIRGHGIFKMRKHQNCLSRILVKTKLFKDKHRGLRLKPN